MKGEILSIEKRYGRRPVLRGASFSFSGGDGVAVAGANGSGKSTLLRVLSGVLKADGGQFLLDGTDLLSVRAAANTVAYVPQGTPLIEELTARDNLRLWYGKTALEASLDGGLLRELGVHEFLNTPARKLSGGMRKRLSIGCAVAGDPRVLLLDEPTAALDLPAKERLLRDFAAFRARGGAVVLATHDPRELAACSHCLLLRRGVLTPYGYDGDAAALARELETP